MTYFTICKHLQSIVEANLPATAMVKHLCWRCVKHGRAVGSIRVYEAMQGDQPQGRESHESRWESSPIATPSENTDLFTAS